ncbi:hypothetical protein [Qipengyuania nanhaisediminis]|uniref:hypothetical protein n=1 Tax=Qipengyuania nanhaisediminis TaxID=604088 RepID=UPI0038B3633F
MSQAEVETLPEEYRSAPTTEEYTETTVGADGVETITRTRRIERMGHPATSAHPAYPAATYYQTAYAPAAGVFEREEWIAECEERTDGRGDREKGGIIGGLLGAIAGGIIGNRVADGERLAGTLIGVGAGGLAGGLLGSLIGGGRDERGEYDCEAALDAYLSQHGQGHAMPVRYAARSIPASYPAYAPAAPAYGYGYSYAPAYNYGYTYQPPQQVVYVPVRYEQPQRVIVRETVREETVPGAARTIPAPPRAAPPTPAPRQPRYIKGN